MTPLAAAGALPHVIVVPVNPLSRWTHSAPAVGVPYPISPPAGSVQFVGAVAAGGLRAAPTQPRVGLPVSAEAENVASGVAAAFRLSAFADCLIAAVPVRVMPETE